MDGPAAAITARDVRQHVNLAQATRGLGRHRGYRAGVGQVHRGRHKVVERVGQGGEHAREMVTTRPEKSNILLILVWGGKRCPKVQGTWESASHLVG